jgi:preprotein translocase subunit SecG
VILLGEGVSTLSHILNLLVILLASFLMLVVLVQKGKGGGLAGAFGGVGGSSPFGSKSGTFFTRLTIIVAAVWTLFIILSVWEAKSVSRENDPDNENFKPSVSLSLGPDEPFTS